MKLLNFAERYIEMGWCVLPLYGNQKCPSFSWKEYQTRLATKEEWLEWVKNPSLTGICLITGAISKIVVVDVDDPELKTTLNSTVVSQTRSGGYHFLYRYADKLKNTVRIDGAPIDFRGDGGLIVLPPSKASGKDGNIGDYKWMLSPTAENMASLPNVPEDISKFLSEKKHEKVSVRDIISTVTGDRNDTLYRYACSCCYQNKKDLAIAFKQVEWLNETFQPPLPRRELETIFKSASEFILSKKEIVNESTEVKVLNYSAMTEEEILKIERPKTARIGIQSLDIDFGFPAGFYIICGVSNVGKGFFGSWIARKFYENNGIKTMMFSLEMPEQLVRDRCLQSWSDKTKEEYEKSGPTKGAIKLLRDSFRVIEFNLYTDMQQNVETFKYDFERFYDAGCRLFIFDHLLEIKGATDNTTYQKVIAEWGKCFQELSKYHKDCWIMVFSQRRIESEKAKKGENKQTVRMADMFGSKPIIAKCDVFIGISRARVEDCDTRDFFVNVDKNRFGNAKFIKKLYFAPDGNFYQEEHEYLHRDRQSLPLPGVTAEDVQSVFELE